MEAQLTRYWWIPGVRGLLAILFGVAALSWPVVTLHVLVLLFGAYALADGILALVTAFSRHGQPRWWAPFLEGLTGLAIALLVFSWPAISTFALLYLIAAWALITGVFEIVAAIRLREQIENEWLLGLAGFASILLGLILIVAPGAGAVGLVWAIGVYAIVYGVLSLLLAFRLRSRGEQARTRAPA